MSVSNANNAIVQLTITERRPGTEGGTQVVVARKKTVARICWLQIWKVGRTPVARRV